ncbi:MAG: toll/interleukin-1 receptor domain-containing protein [Verrucomicrobiales bacterium]|nr:toll/interleukin-1 receptor domain-containing protein [Verrucomicrobiales bacterium]
MSVFISHSRNDQDTVQKVCKGLLDTNVKVWRDSWKMAAGNNLGESIFKAIRDSYVFCVLHSEDSVNSEWVKKETAFALEESQTRNLVIVPLLLDDTPLPDNLADLLNVDLRTDFDKAIRRIKQFVDTEHAKRYSGKIKEAYPYILNWGREILESDGRMFMQLDTVGTDAEAEHILLAQFMFTELETGGREALNFNDSDDISYSLIHHCANEFRQNSSHVSLKSGETRRASLTISDSSGKDVFKLTLRIRRLGVVTQTSQVVDVGGILIRIDDEISGKEIS